MSRLSYFPNTDEGSNGQLGNLLSAILYGGRCIGYRKLAFDDAPAVGLGDIADPDGVGALTAGIPSGARSAVIVLEADATEVDFPRVARFTEDGTTPTASEGMPLGDNGSVEIKGEDNLAAFRIIGITAAKTHTLRVAFYGAG